MPRHFEKRILPYTAEQIYALVADVERYPAFLPWCLRCEVLQRDEGMLKAQMQVGTKALCEHFISWVTLEPHRAIHVEYAGGALSALRNEWTFEPRADDACEVTFFVEFKLKSRLLGAMMDLFFDAAFRQMVSAFESRAAALYGDEENGTVLAESYPV